MNITKKAKIVIAAIAAVLLIVVIILVTVNGGKNSRTSIDGYDITGTWYSDRENGDTLILDPSGTYTSTNWLAGGKYSIDGTTVLLTDAFGDTKSLTFSQSGGAYVLRFENAPYTHTYYRTEQEVVTAQEEQQASEEIMQAYHNEVLMQILTTGEWKGADNLTTLQFTENSFVITYAGTTYPYTEAAIVNYTYNILSAKEFNGGYEMQWDLSVKYEEYDEPLDFQNIFASITITEGNTYKLHCNSFAYDLNFTKPIESAPTTPPISDSSAQSNYLSASEQAEINAFTEEAVYGTWKGTLEEYPNENTPYNTFIFNRDGTYSYSFGDISETGTFRITHQNDILYHSTFHFVTSIGEEKTLNFYITDPDSGSVRLRIQSISDNIYPTLFKQ